MTKVKTDNNKEDLADVAADQYDAVPTDEGSLLDRLPVGTLITLLGVLTALYAYVTGQITFEEFQQALALSGVAGGSIGIARNGAGKGTLG